MALLKEEEREAYYEEWDEEDQMLACDEADQVRAELVSEIWGDAEQYQESDETGWLYTDEDDEF